jgi:hypothetical protein
MILCSEEMRAIFWLVKLQVRNHSENLGVDGRMDLREIGWEGGHRIYLAQDTDQWRALVNTVMNLQIP